MDVRSLAQEVSAVPVPLQLGSREMHELPSVPLYQGGADHGNPPWFQQLRSPLLGWLRRRVQDAATAEDIAAETVLRAWQELSASTPWPVLWCWALTTADRLRADIWRKKGREHTNVRGDMELLRRPTLAASELQTLQLLQAGLTDNEQIASMRSLTVRAIQKSRRRLGDAAIAAWKECRAVRLRASLPVRAH